MIERCSCRVTDLRSRHTRADSPGPMLHYRFSTEVTLANEKSRAFKKSSLRHANRPDAQLPRAQLSVIAGGIAASVADDRNCWGFPLAVAVELRKRQQP